MLRNGNENVTNYYSIIQFLINFFSIPSSSRIKVLFLSIVSFRCKKLQIDL